MIFSLKALSKNIGYEFSELSLLERALTHRSKNKNNYERLEFLGDSILSFVISDWLYRSFDNLGEGKLSRMRASVVCKESLAEVARSLNLSDYLILGEGEMKSGGFNRDSILSDAIEGIIGAIYIDSGFEQSKAFILRFFQKQLEQLEPEVVYKDSKSQLQEVLQKRGLDLPMYSVVETTGEQHQQCFRVQCEIKALEKVFYSKGSNRKEAEQKAAAQAVEAISSH